MRVVVVTPPAAAVTWEEADAHLKLDGDISQRSMVEAFIAAATATIDGPTGWLGRSVGKQTLEARFDLGWDVACLRLPLGPVITLNAATYLDGAGAEHEADVAEIDLLGDEVVPLGDTFPWRGQPPRREGLRLRYEAGYTQVPAPIKAAILLMVGDLYRFRTTASDMSVTPTSIPMSLTVENLLQGYRVFR